MLISRRTLLTLAPASLLAFAELTPANIMTQALAAPNAGAQNAGFNIVEGGVARAVIVTPDTPLPTVQYAATELQWHIERATGVKLDILPEGKVAADAAQNRIYLGRCRAAEKIGLDVQKLAPNAFIKKITANALFLVGNDTAVVPPVENEGSMGTLFAVYDWLENQVGVKWLWPAESGTVVLKISLLRAGASGERTVFPALIHSQPRLNTWKGMNPAIREKYIYDTSVWLRRQRFVRGVSFQYGHAYTNYWERFGKTHPEYFAQRPDGIRAPFNEKRPNLVQMCVSNPGLHQQIVADWLVQRKEKPNLPWINGTENDKTAQDPACTCEVCRSWDAKQATAVAKNPWLSGAETGKKGAEEKISLSDRYARFWLALQEEGKKHDPNATVIGYAYADYTAPPVETKLNNNIIVGIVPPYSFPLDEKQKEEFRALWSGWAKTGARLYLRPNYFLVGYCMPYIFADEFGGEFRYAAEHGMVGTDFDSLLGMWGVQGLNLYMMGRLNVDPKVQVADILNEYYAAFGAAAQPIREYFEYWRDITKKCDGDFKERSKGGWAFVSKSGDEVYTPATFQQGASLLAKAEKAAGDDAAVQERIAYLKFWLDHAELCMKALSAFHAQKAKPDDPALQESFLQAKAAVDEFRQSHEAEIGNTGLLRQLEIWSGWRKSSELGG